MQRTTVALLALTLAFPTLTGCLVMGGGQEIDYDENERAVVSFESIVGCQRFHDGIGMADRDPYMDQGGIALPFLVFMGGTTFHETQFYNAQVRECDFDRDEVITDAEAQAYFARMTRQRNQD